MVLGVGLGKLLTGEASVTIMIKLKDRGRWISYRWPGPHSGRIGKTRGLSKIIQQSHPELQRERERLMKVVTKSKRTLEALVAATTKKNGNVDKRALERGLDSVIADMERVNRSLDELLAKARA
jgi:hypothetical protein